MKCEKETGNTERMEDLGTMAEMRRLADMEETIHTITGRLQRTQSFLYMAIQEIERLERRIEKLEEQKK